MDTTYIRPLEVASFLKSLKRGENLVRETVGKVFKKTFLFSFWEVLSSPVE